MAEYNRLIREQADSYVSQNARAAPELWQERLRELIASDPKRVQAILEKAHRGEGQTDGGNPEHTA